MFISLKVKQAKEIFPLLNHLIEWQGFGRRRIIECVIYFRFAFEWIDYGIINVRVLETLLNGLKIECRGVLCDKLHFY